MKNDLKQTKPISNPSVIKDYSNRVSLLVGEYENDISLHLNSEYIKNTKWSDRLADKIAAFGGSWTFIMIFGLFLGLWMTWNTMSMTSHFDPRPFILLNLILSFIAAFQAPIILMSQNRQTARDRRESLIDFAINYKAEEEIDDMQNHLHRIEEELAQLKSLLSTIALK